MSAELPPLTDEDIRELAGAPESELGQDISWNGSSPTHGDKWPTPLSEAAFHGLAGEFVERVKPHSEAGEAALLGQYLTAAGNLFGTGTYYQVEGVRHPARLFVAIVGATSKARKGTAWSRVRQVAEGVDPDWAARVSGGLSSGEGPLWAVRDQIIRKVAIKEDGKPTGEFEDLIEDPGVEDKRLLVVEAEFSRHFDVIARSGNTLGNRAASVGRRRRLLADEELTREGDRPARLGHRPHLAGGATAQGDRYRVRQRLPQPLPHRRLEAAAGTGLRR